EEPATRMASAAATASRATSYRALGTFSPKKTTSGLSSPPHGAQRGGSKDSIAEASMSASPSGAVAADGFHGVLTAVIAAWTEARDVRSRQFRQTTTSRRP